MFGKAKFPQSGWIVIAFALVITFLVSPNILIMIPLLLYIPFSYQLFYIKGNVNVIFWGLMYQWLNVSSQAIYCTIMGQSLGSLFEGTIFPANLMEYTDFLSITGMYIFCLGIYMAIKKMKVVFDDTEWEKYEPQKMINTYIIVSVIITINQAAIWAFPSVVQYFYFLFYIKWGFFMAMFLVVYKRAPHLRIFILVIITVEFILGLSSFWASSFANILMYSLITFSALSKKISYGKAIIFVVLGVGLFHIAVLWTAAKGNYRSYVSQGQNVQAVKVSQDEAREKLVELIQKVDGDTYVGALQELVNRVGYIQYFASSVRFVPEFTPHEYGQVYLAALSHYLVPRFINPDKPELDDSKHTNQYTGLNVSGKSRASSFSLGTYADAYIDFGPIGMFVPIFLFGFAIGHMFQYLYKPDLWGIIFTAPFFLLINIYGADTTKAIGFLLIYFLVMFILKRFLKNTFDPMMKKAIKN